MSIRSGIKQALVRIGNTQNKAGRPGPVKLEFAMKTGTPEECYEAAHVLAELGRPILLGHNHVQETRNTVTTIQQIERAKLHLIGPLQSNKINHAPGCADAIESVDCPVLAEKISVRVNWEVPTFLEVNASGEETKHGCHPNEVDALVDTAFGAEHLRLYGFMTVSLNSFVEKGVRTTHAQLRSICERTEATTGLRDLELSMGMSADLEWVIMEGASIVKIGTAVFDEHRPRD